VTEAVLVPRLAVGPLAGVAAFVVLAGGRCPRPRAFLLRRAVALRWLGLGAIAGLEEVVWRGLVLGGLRIAIGPVAALVLSSAGFAFWHRPALGRRCGAHLVTGAAFGTAFLAGGLVAAILAHWIYNLLVDWAMHAERARLRGP
jgi:membrane protease YdiL (CAAX protease family)